jgi:cytochrome P450
MHDNSNGCPVNLADVFGTEPAAWYAKLRDQAPVHRAVTPDGAPVWLVIRDAEVRTLINDPRLSVDKTHALDGYQGFSLPPELDATLLNMDPPAHTRVRSLTAKAFTPRNIARWRPRIQEIASELADTLDGCGNTDLITAYAAPLPITVIAEILGVPEHDRMRFKACSDEMFAPTSVEHTRQAIGELREYLIDLVATRRANPGQDLLSELIAVRDAEDQLGEHELTSAAFGILLGGYENTVNLLGNGVLALLTHPEQMAALHANPDLLPAAIDELLRWESPSQLAIRRFPLEDITFGETVIPTGETVMLSLASACRDPEQYADPDTLDLARDHNPHLAFGHGPHYCVGANLARAEAEIGLGTLLHHFPALDLAVAPDQVSWRPSFRQRGLRTLPVTL